MGIILAVILTLGIFIVCIKRLKGFKSNTRSIAMIGIVAAISILLSMIKLVPFPQGGGITLLSVLPVMILSTLVGIEEGILCAIIVASLQAIIEPPFFPLQLPLDYFGSMVAIAFTPMFGTKKKTKLILGALLAGLLSTTFSVLSGVLFFGQFAPKGMNLWLYSIVYNFLGRGVEILLAIIVLNILPLKSIKKRLRS